MRSRRAANTTKRRGSLPGVFYLSFTRVHEDIHTHINVGGVSITLFFSLALSKRKRCTDAAATIRRSNAANTKCSERSRELYAKLSIRSTSREFYLFIFFNFTNLFKEIPSFNFAQTSHGLAN